MSKELEWMNEFVRGCQKGEHELKPIPRDNEPVWIKRSL